MLNVSDVIRGCTDTVILALLNESDSYGYRINRDISERSDSQLELKEATLYTSFRRLESSGLIMSYWGDSSAGARRRYYAITENGRAVLRENIADWEKTRNLLDKLITNTKGNVSEDESEN